MSPKSIKNLKSFHSNAKLIPVLWSENLGSPTLKMTLSIRELIDMSDVFNVDRVEELGLPQHSDAQRQLNPLHAKGLAQYIVIGLVETTISSIRGQGGTVSQKVLNLQAELGKSEYSSLQPIVTNIRKCKPGGEDLEFEEIIEITPAGDKRVVENIARLKYLPIHIMSVVDGQHRRAAFQLVMTWLKEIYQTQRYPVKGIFNLRDTLSKGELMDSERHDFWEQVLNYALSASFISIECHLGASVEQERQLFSDLNSKGRKVELAQSLEYDTSNPINVLVHDLIEDEAIGFNIVQKDFSSWHDDTGAQVRKDLNQITSLVVLGKTSSKTATPVQVNKASGLAKAFWERVQMIPGFGRSKAKTVTVAAQPVVLKGLARLIHDLAMGKAGTADEEGLKKLWASMVSGKLDFSHDNPLWRSLMLSREEREADFSGISDYVHVPLGTNLDAGTYNPETGLVRYGSKHNDIYPRIGDLIRYQLKLKPRTTVTSAIARENKESAKAA